MPKKLVLPSSSSPSTERAKAFRDRLEQTSVTRWEIFASEATKNRVRDIARLENLTAGVAAEALLELGRLRSKPALEALFRGLESGDPAFVTRVNQELVNLVNSQFDSYEEATEWWKVNSEKFDERLIRTVD